MILSFVLLPHALLTSRYSCQALQALSPLADLVAQPVTVYIPVPESNGEEWDRLPEESALAALVGVALEGEYTGVAGLPSPGSGSKELESFQIRTTAANVLEVRRRSKLETSSGFFDVILIRSLSELLVRQRRHETEAT